MEPAPRTPEPVAERVAPGLDERVLSAGTTVRFVLLLVLFTVAGAGMSTDVVGFLSDSGNASIGCVLAGGGNPEVGFGRGVLPSLADVTALKACLNGNAPTYPWVSIVAPAALLLAAAVLFQMLPRWKTRRSRAIDLESVDQDGRVSRRLSELREKVGIPAGLRIRYVVDVCATRTGAVVYGTRRRPVLRVHGGLFIKGTSERDEDRMRFDAVILHELAHIRNGDVGITYATVAMWRVFLAGVLLPEAIVAVDALVTERAPLQWGTLVLDESRLVLEVLIMLMVYLTRADILRIREVYADRTAASRGAVPEYLVPGWSAAGGGPDRRRRGARLATVAVELWRTHPSWASRARALKEPDVLFRPSALSVFLAGSAADVVVSQVRSIGGVTEQAWVTPVGDLAVSALVIGIGGVALWRSVARAVVEGGVVPSGWRVGLWSGLGLAVGELAQNGVSDSRWLPPHPEAVLILVAVTSLLMAWTAQCAELRIRAFRGRRLTTAMIFGLVTPWLALAFVLGYWNSVQLVDGWRFSAPAFLTLLGVTSPHPALLLRWVVFLPVLPGADRTFTGFWWALPLLWLYPLVRWTAVGPVSTPPWLTRSKPQPTVSALDRPVPRHVAGGCLVGGFLCCVGLLGAAWGVGTVGPRTNTDIDLAADLMWNVLVIITAMAIAAVVAAASDRPYFLLRALIAAGLTGMFGVIAACLLAAVDGCVGPFNVFEAHTCAIRPAEQLPVASEWLRYTVIDGLLVSAALAPVARAVSTLVRGNRSRNPPAPIADSPGKRGVAARRLAVGIVAVATTAAVTAETADRRSTGSTGSSGAVVVRYKNPAPPSPTTRRLQVWAWTYYGGGDVLHEFSSADQAMLDVLDKASASLDLLKNTSEWKAAVGPSCLQVYVVADKSTGYFLVPAPEGERMWAGYLDRLNDAVTACQRLERTGSRTDGLIAVTDDLNDALSELDDLVAWIERTLDISGPTTTPPSEATETWLGTSLIAIGAGNPLTMAVSDYELHPVAVNAEHVPVADRIATFRVRTCVKGTRATKTPRVAVPTWASWHVILADGSSADPVRAWSQRDFGEPLYPNDSHQRLSPGECRTGLIPFDIPASTTADPVEIAYSAKGASPYWRVPRPDRSTVPGDTIGRPLTADRLKAALVGAGDLRGYTVDASGDPINLMKRRETVSGGDASCQTLVNADDGSAAVYGTVAEADRTFVHPAGDIAITVSLRSYPTVAEARAVVADLRAGLPDPNAGPPPRCHRFTARDQWRTVTAQHINLIAGSKSRDDVAYSAIVTANGRQAQLISRTIQVGTATVTVHLTTPVPFTAADAAAIKPALATIRRVEVNELKTAQLGRP